MNKITLSLFLSGILFGSGPCLASCGPILISYIAGTEKNPLQGLTVYVLFSLARILVYLLLGIAVFSAGRFALETLLGNLSKYMFITAGSFISILGLLMLLGKRLEYAPCRFLQKNMLEHDKKSVLVLGLFTGLLPCAPLIAVLSYVGLISKTWTASLWYSFSFGLGTFISPLIFFAVLAGLTRRLLRGRGAVYSRIFNSLCALVIIFLGIQLIRKAF